MASRYGLNFQRYFADVFYYGTGTVPVLNHENTTFRIQIWISAKMVSGKMMPQTESAALPVTSAATSSTMAKLTNKLLFY
jgi:hypothetical protein